MCTGFLLVDSEPGGGGLTGPFHQVLPSSPASSSHLPPRGVRLVARCQELSGAGKWVLCWGLTSQDASIQVSSCFPTLNPLPRPETFPRNKPGGGVFIQSQGRRSRGRGGLTALSAQLSLLQKCLSLLGSPLKFSCWQRPVQGQMRLSPPP